MDETKKYTGNTIIGDVIKDTPKATKVIKKYFGQGWFTCPGMKMEFISFDVMMHNINPNAVVKWLHELE